MGLLKWITGTSDTADKAVDMIASAGDKMFYTDEEKADMAKASYDKITDFILKSQGEFTPRSITRRILAVIAYGVFFFSFLVALVFVCIGDYNTPNVIMGLVKAYKLPEIIITITIFYFGYYGIMKIVEGKKKKEE